MRHITMIAAILALLLSCTPKENADIIPLQVTPESVSFEGLGGEQKTISVVSGTDWYARSSENWLKVHIASGEGSEEPSKCRISVDDNFTGADRTGKINIKNLDGDSFAVTVTQTWTEDSHTVRGISTLQDFMNFAAAVNSEGSVAQYLVDGVVKFNNDIDCSSVTEWVPIGTDDIPLIYNIDGNNKTLKNVHWSIDISKYPAAGLIGVADGVRIRRLTLGDKGNAGIEFSGNPSGKVRAGAVVGRCIGVTMEKVTNNADLAVKGTTAQGNSLILGGLAGYADPESVIGGDMASTKGCRNFGNISVPVVAQAGGLVGYISGTIENCTFDATITGPSDGTDGPGWICSHCKARMEDISGNTGKGYVGDTPAMMRNSMMNYKDGYDPEANTVDWTLDAYYDWNVVETRKLHDGATYYHYSCTNVPREIHVVEVDLKNPGIGLEAAWAGDMIPNPNGNANDNNGFKLRERLSDVCKRKRSEGSRILAGVNAGFFDSNAGIGRGFYVEDGQPLYINNPAVVENFPNHAWAFTVFTDGTASCGKKVFSGKLRANGKEYGFSTVNDTTLRHSNPEYQANLFTSHYVRTPYPNNPVIVNELAKNVLYVICEYVSSPMTVNTGYASAKVVEIRDGRSTALSSAPYLTQKKRVGIALSGDMADEWKGFIKVGDVVELGCEIMVDGEAKPIQTLISSMFQLMSDGNDASSTPPASHTIVTTYDPKTFPVVSRDLTKVWLVQVDGRKLWYSLGVRAYEIYRIAKKLGGAWVTGFDGGGSSAMWVWDDGTGKGAVVGRPADTRGERSNMNYLLVRAK